jgi:MFS family permease
MGTFIGPIISGNIAAHISWRWFFWVCTIAQALNLIIIVFMFPETRFRRETSHFSETSSSIGNDTDLEAKSEAISVLTETNTASKVPTLDDSVQKSLPRSQSASIQEIRRPSNQHLHTGRPSKAQFSVIQKFDYEGNNLFLRDIIAPVQVFSFPIILWASLSMGFAANCLLALNLTQSQVFAAPPYLFTPAQVGFVNFAFVVGGAVGLLTAGPFSDWVSMRATVRNEGVREAEMRLLSLVPYIAICLVGMTVSH